MGVSALLPHAIEELEQRGAARGGRDAAGLVALVQTLERERKLAGPAEVLDALDGEPIEPRTFTSTYHDTADRRLARHGYHAAAPARERRQPLAAEAPARGGEARARASAAGPAACARAARAPARRRPARHRARGGGDAPDPPHRQAGDARPGGTVEAVLDEVAAAGGTARCGRLHRARAGAGRRRSRGARGGRAGARRGRRRGGRAAAEGAALPRRGAEGRRPPRTRGDRPRSRADRGAVRRDAAPRPGTRVGDDPEDLHDLRVAVRRLRALLRAADVLLVPEWSEPLRDELKWLGGELGPARDLDVLLAHLRAEAERLGEDEVAFAEVLQRLESGAGRRARAPARGARERPLPRRCSTRSRPPRARRTPVRSTRRSTSSRRAEFQRLAKAVRELGDDPSDEELHRVRIKGKRARYAAELAEPVVGKPAARFVAQAKSFQDVVGDHQDAVVAEERLRAARRGAGVERGRARRRARRRAPARAASGGPGSAAQGVVEARARRPPRVGVSERSFARPAASSCGTAPTGTEVLLVHRPAYDDWSLPKGKAHRGERDEDCALREVEEETGLAASWSASCPSTSYRDGARAAEGRALLGDAAARRRGRAPGRGRRRRLAAARRGEGSASPGSATAPCSTPL